MKRYRSAVTGEYVTEEYAEANPSTTVAEDTTVGETEDAVIQGLPASEIFFTLDDSETMWGADVDEDSPTADEKWWEDPDDIPF